jgi:DNA-binding transcriptional LysR family regulator
MDLDSITVFVKIVESGSFSAAARLLDMPKTTVSAKLAALEKRLGLNLIQRTTRSLRVTEAGAKYFLHCANAVREVELAEAAMQTTRGKPTGLLRITAPVDVGHTLLPRIARTYLAKYPGTSIELMLSNSVVDLVGEGVDLAIRAGNLKDSSLIAKRFFDTRANLCASPAYLKSLGKLTHPRQLAKARFIGFNKFQMLRLSNGKSEVEVPIASRIVADDLEAIKVLAILGEGIGWLPDFLSADAVQAGTLAPVLPAWKSKALGAVYFVYPGHKYASPKIQAFIQTAMEAYPISQGSSPTLA